MSECVTEITDEQYQAILNFEAVVIIEFEKEDGSRYGELHYEGDLDECQAEAERPELIIRFKSCDKIIGKTAVRVCDLIKPTEDRP